MRIESEPLIATTNAGADAPSDQVNAAAAKAAPGPSAGMATLHERPNPDTSFRVRAPLAVLLHDGTRISVREWSLRAIHDHALAGHDLADARLEIPFQGFEIGFPVQLRAVPDREEWLFEGLTGRQREALALFHRNLISGRMASTGEIITALDTPVDLIPMGQTDAERDESRAAPRLGRMVWKVASYVALFALVFGFLGRVVWNRLEYLPLSNARYAAPLQQMTAPRQGFVQEVLVPEGASVTAGEVILRLQDPEMTAALGEVRAAIDRAELRLNEVNTQIALHMESKPAARALAKDPARFDAGFSDQPGDFNDLRLRLEADRRAAELDLRALRGERGRIREAALAMEIHAPGDGIVADLLVPAGSYQRAGTPLVLFEAATPREVIGWLDGAAAGSVWPGMQAAIHYTEAGQNKTVAGVVTAVDASADPALPDRSGIVVHLALPGLTAEQSRALLPDNTPVRVDLRRGLVQRWFGGGA